MAKKVPSLNGGYSQKALEKLDKGTYGESHASQRQAHEYQNAQNKKKREVSYNETAKANEIKLERADKQAVTHDYVNNGEESALNVIKSRGLEQKYGKSADEIMKSLVANRKNDVIDSGKKLPILTELGTLATSIPRAVLGLESATASAIAPDSKVADYLENRRNDMNQNVELLRSGVKEHTGDTGDKVIDTVNDIGDRLVPSLVGSAINPVLGAGLTAGITTNTKMDELSDRGIDGRSQALQALAYGGIEGAGDYLTAGLWNKVKPASSALGKVVGGAFRGAADNAMAETAEQYLDRWAGGDKSKWETNKAVAMLNGMSEADAEDYADKQDRNDRLMAAGTGALFGGATAAMKIPELRQKQRQAIIDEYALGNPKSDVDIKATDSKGEVSKAGEMLNDANKIVNGNGTEPIVTAEPNGKVATNSVEADLTARASALEAELANTEPGSVEESAVFNELAQVRSELDNLQKDMNIPEEPNSVPNVQNTEANQNNGTVATPTQNNANLGQNTKPQYDVSGEEKVSNTYSNTARNSGIETEAEFNSKTPESDYKYTSVVEKKTVSAARNDINTRGGDVVANELLNAEEFDAVDTDKAMMLWKQYVQDARALDESGADSTAAWNKANAMLKKVQTQLTRYGQATQALAKWTRNTPEGMLMDAERIINNAINKSSTNKTLAGMKSRKMVELSPEFQRDFLNLAQQIIDIGDVDAIDAKQLYGQLGKMINTQIPVKFSEKVTALLMDNMLGNVRTLLTRNAGGNVGFGALEQAKKPIASTLDKLLSKITNKRTTANWSRETFKEYMDGFVTGLKEEKLDFDNDIHTSRSGMGSSTEALEEATSANRHVFNNKILDTYDKLVKHGLSVGDRPFYEGTYKQTLKEYQLMREQGLFGADVMALNDSQFDEVAKTAAKMNALAAVYQDDSVLAKGLMDIKNGLGDVSKGVFGVDVLSQFSMPFVKTPANLVTRTIEYSPLGLVKNVVNTVKEVGGAEGANLGERIANGLDQNRFVNESARNILGTGLFAGGLGLAKAGGLTGAYSEDKDMKQAQKNAGMQEYALNVGDKNVDISWVPVVGTDMVAAASAYDALKNSDDRNLINDVSTGMKAGMGSLFDQSVFQGAQRLFGGSGSSYNNDEGLVGNVVDTIKSGASQAVPSIVRQATQSIDPYERDVSGNYYDDSIKASLPLLRQSLEKKVDTEGNVVKSNQGRPLWSRLLENMVLPGKVTEDVSSKVNGEAMRIYEATNGANKEAFMPSVSRTDMTSGAKDENYKPTDKQYANFKKAVGKANTEAGEALIDNEIYQMMSDAEKADAFQTMYSAIKAAKKNDLDNGYSNDSGACKAYTEGGTQGLIDYITDGYLADQLGLTRDTYRKQEAEYKGGAEQYAQDKQTALDLGYVTKDGKANVDSYNKALEAAEGDTSKLGAILELNTLGLDKSSSVYTYLHATTVVPSLTPSQYAQMVRPIDTDGNQKVNQEEFLNYINKNNLSKDEIDTLWKIFKSGTTKKVPYLKDNGSWGLK